MPSCNLDMSVIIYGLLICYEQKYIHNPGHCLAATDIGKVSTHSKPGPEVIKLFLCSTQLSMKFFLLINVKMPTIVGILTFLSGKNRILDLSEPAKS